MSSMPKRSADEARPHPWAGPREADVAEGQVTGAHLLLWGYRNMQIMMELNQALFSIGCDLLNRQYEAMTEMLRRSAQAASDVTNPANEDGIADVARASMQAFDRILAAMQVGNDRGRASTGDARPGAGNTRSRAGD